MSKSQFLCSISELWTSFTHGKSTFFKLCPTKKMWEIKLSFISQNPFVLWSFHAKAKDKFERKGMKFFELWMFFELYSWVLNGGFIHNIHKKISSIYYVFIIIFVLYNYKYNIFNVSIFCVWNTTFLFLILILSTILLN
jgi:hypothetical protein